MTKRDNVKDLFRLMEENNIDGLINSDNFIYFTRDTINYILNLNLQGIQLKCLIILIASGLLSRIDEKQYYKIIRDVKHVKEEAEISSLILKLNNEYLINEKSLIKKSKTK